MKTIHQTMQFIAGGGEMGALIRDKDWRNSPIGNPETWPQSLRTTLSIILNSKFPMFLFWGPDLLCFYNDAYRPSFGIEGKHPAILGSRAEDYWQEIWTDIKPLIDHVLAGGEANWSEDQLLPIYRNNTIENVYWTFSYSAVNDESGKPAGVFVTCTETTEQVRVKRIIEESEKRFRAMADNISQFAWMADEKGWIYWYNQRWYDFTGTTLEDMQGWGWQKVHHPDHIDRVVKRIQYSWNTGEDWEDTFPLRGKDGQYRWFLSRAIPVKNDEGKILNWFGTNTDITEQKKAEDQFRILADQAPLWIWMTDKNINILYANPPLLQFLNLSHYTEFTGQVWQECVHVDDIHVINNSYVDAILHQKAFDLECRLNNATTGLYEWFYVKSVPHFENNELTGFIGTAINIHQQKAQIAALMESEERFRMLAQTLPQLVWVTDEKGNQEFASEKWQAYTGIKPSNEESWRAMVHPDDFDDINKAWMHCLQTGEQYKFDVRLKHKDGSYRWFTVNGEPLLDSDHKIIKWVGAFTDTHFEKGFSEELKKQVENRTQELEKANQSLEDKNEQLDNTNKELQSFTYISSHDLQEPLRKIQTFASRIIEKEHQNLSNNGKDYFKRMQLAAARMQQLIEDLLTFSRLSSSERVFENIDLNDMVEELMNDLKEELHQKNAVIEVSPLCKINIISFQFRQLFQNLISNSLKFSKPHQPPHITVKSEKRKGSSFDNPKFNPEKKYCHITFMDNGIGFDELYNEKIFEVFQRLNDKEKYSGTGIGLAIVKKIVENHNGFVTAKGILNEGAIFDIYIPTN